MSVTCSQELPIQMIFDGLLSRTRLRSQLAERSELELGFPSQVRYSTSLLVGLCIDSKRALVPVHSLTLTVCHHHKPMKESEHQRQHMGLFLSSRWRISGRARRLRKNYLATRRTPTRNLKVNPPRSQALAMTSPYDSAKVNELGGDGDMGI